MYLIYILEARDNNVSSLQEKVYQWDSDLKKCTKNCKLQRDYKAAVSQQQKESDELDHLTRENQPLFSEIKRLQAELEAALNENQKAKKENAPFLQAHLKRRMQEKELHEKKYFEQMVLQRQVAVDPLTDLIGQLQTFSASSESLKDEHAERI